MVVTVSSEQSILPAPKWPARKDIATDRFITHAQARTVYDRIGRWQDTRPVSERRALDALLEYAAFERAASVVEFGCGTGRLAARLLAERLPPGATYLGVDVSPRMVSLARGAIGPWAGRARVEQADGPVRLPVADGAADRFLSTYVIDLLSPTDTDDVLREARRVLRPGGLLALASLTPGRAPLSRGVTCAWVSAWRLHPVLVGGCRPVRLAALLPEEAWRVGARLTVTDVVLASEVVVAERL
jgi:SAM-dependent methyltransferase